MRIQFSGSLSRSALLRSLRDRKINYAVAEVRGPEWNFDLHRHHLGTEAPGPPVAEGLWRRACGLVHDYQFTPPEILRAVYLERAPLLGRDLLLEGRFTLLRFLMGVRITRVTDQVHDGRQVRGWSYETLEGHLERGQVDYEVVKDLASGAVDFVARSYSQVNPRVGLVLRLGWALFGRRTQLRFYRRVGPRLAALVHSESSGAPPAANHHDGVMSVPAGAGPSWWDRCAWAIPDPAGCPERRRTRGT